MSLDPIYRRQYIIKVYQKACLFLDWYGGDKLYVGIQDRSTPMQVYSPIESNGIIHHWEWYPDEDRMSFDGRKPFKASEGNFHAMMSLNEIVKDSILQRTQILSGFKSKNYSKEQDPLYPGFNVLSKDSITMHFKEKVYKAQVAEERWVFFELNPLHQTFSRKDYITPMHRTHLDNLWDNLDRFLP